MTEQKFDPLKEIANLRDNLSRTLQQGIKNIAGEATPAVDIYETDTELVIETEGLVGLIPTSLEITVEGDTLTFKGQTSPNPNILENMYLQRERAFGDFQRSLRLPRAVKATSAKASIKKGILTIRLPKQSEDTQIISITPIQE